MKYLPVMAPLVLMGCTTFAVDVKEPCTFDLHTIAGVQYRRDTNCSDAKNRERQAESYMEKLWRKAFGEDTDKDTDGDK